MTGALVVVRHQPVRRLDRIRGQAQWALARAAFAAETLAIAAGLLVLITFAILRFDPITASHEWGLFLTHYAAAAGPARAPVDRTLVVLMIALTGFVAACRWPATRSAWRHAKRQVGRR
jgi:hypothetical protein